MVNIRQTLNIKDKGRSIKYDINFVTRLDIFMCMYTHTQYLLKAPAMPCPVLSSSHVLAHVVL